MGAERLPSGKPGPTLETGQGPCVTGGKGDQRGLEKAPVVRLNLLCQGCGRPDQSGARKEPSPRGAGRRAELTRAGWRCRTRPSFSYRRNRQATESRTSLRLLSGRGPETAAVPRSVLPEHVRRPRRSGSGRPPPQVWPPRPSRPASRLRVDLARRLSRCRGTLVEIPLEPVERENPRVVASGTRMPDSSATAAMSCSNSTTSRSAVLQPLGPRPLIYSKSAKGLSRTYRSHPPAPAETNHRCSVSASSATSTGVICPHTSDVLVR